MCFVCDSSGWVKRTLFSCSCAPTCGGRPNSEWDVRVTVKPVSYTSLRFEWDESERIKDMGLGYSISIRGVEDSTRDPTGLLPFIPCGSDQVTFEALEPDSHYKVFVQPIYQSEVLRFRHGPPVVVKTCSPEESRDDQGEEVVFDMYSVILPSIPSYAE